MITWSWFGTSSVPECSTAGAAPPCSSQPVDVFDHDEDGNLIAAPLGATPTAHTLEWDAENRLKAAYPTAPEAGSKKVEYTYDYMNRRVRRQVFDWDPEAGENGDWETIMVPAFRLAAVHRGERLLALVVATGLGGCVGLAFRGPLYGAIPGGVCGVAMFLLCAGAWCLGARFCANRVTSPLGFWIAVQLGTVIISAVLLHLPSGDRLLNLYVSPDFRYAPPARAYYAWERDPTFGVHFGVDAAGLADLLCVLRAVPDTASPTPHVRAPEWWTPTTPVWHGKSRQGVPVRIWYDARNAAAYLEILFV